MRIDKKKLWKQLAFCITSCAVIIICYFVVKGKIQNRMRTDYLNGLTAIQDGSLALSVKQISITDNELKLNGDISYFGEDGLSDDVKLVLIDMSEDKKYELVMNSFSLDLDQNNSVFTYYSFDAELKNGNKIKKDKCYQICILTKNDELLVDTNQYIYNYQLYGYNPIDYIEPAKTGTDLDDIFSNGKLCGYHASYGLYIYYYQRSLYYISSTNFEFVKNQPGYFPIVIRPQNVNDLSENSREKGIEFYDFYLEYSQPVFTDQNMYTVIQRPLPEYNIAFLSIGYYDEATTWLWKLDIRIES